MTKWRASFLTLPIVALLVVFSELVIPFGVGKYMTGAMAKAVGSNKVEVKAIRSPGLLMLGGEFTEIHVDAAEARLGNIVFSKIKGTLRDVNINMSEIFNSKLVFSSLGHTDVVAEIRQEDLAKVVDDKVQGAEKTQVVITPEGVSIKSRLTFGPFKADVAVDGQIVSNGQIIKLVTNKVAVQNTKLGNIGGIEIPLVDVKQLPFGVVMRQVVMENGKVLLYADNRDAK